MILVHRAGGAALFINADLIEEIEPGPPSSILLQDGRRITVSDRPDELIERITRFRASVILAAEEHRIAPAPALRLAPDPVEG